MPDTWQQIQYQPIVEPIGDPSIWFDADPLVGGWQPPTEQAVWPIEYRYWLKDVAFVMGYDESLWDEAPPHPPPTSNGEQEWLASWQQVRIEYWPRSDSIEIYEPTVFVEPTTPSVAELYAWQRPTEAPVRGIEYLYLLPSLSFQGDPTTFVEPSGGAETTHRIVFPERFQGRRPEGFEERRRPETFGGRHVMPFDDGF